MQTLLVTYSPGTRRIEAGRIEDNMSQYLSSWIPRRSWSPEETRTLRAQTCDDSLGGVSRYEASNFRMSSSGIIKRSSTSGRRSWVEIPSGPGAAPALQMSGQANILLKMQEENWAYLANRVSRSSQPKLNRLLFRSLESKTSSKLA